MPKNNYVIQLPNEYKKILEYLATYLLGITPEELVKKLIDEYIKNANV